MAYEIVLPPDTRAEIEEFIEAEYSNQTEQLEALRYIEREVAYLKTNPMLGTSVPGGPFESRRIYRFLVPLSATGRTTAEFAYTVLQQDGLIVISGFRPLP
jgi:hypothetical protein